MSALTRVRGRVFGTGSRIRDEELGRSNHQRMGNKAEQSSHEPFPWKFLEPAFAHIAVPPLIHFPFEAPCNASTPKPVNQVNNIRLLNLPVELQLMVLEYLNFGEIEAFRRTCRVVRNGVSKDHIRVLFPELKLALLSTCRQCLVYDSSRNILIREPETHRLYPFASSCVTCTVIKKPFKIGQKVTMGNCRVSYICRYCGLPTPSSPRIGVQFHKPCLLRYQYVLYIFFFIGVMQWFVTLTGSALCWRFFKIWMPVLIPTVVRFECVERLDMLADEGRFRLSCQCGLSS